MEWVKDFYSRQYKWLKSSAIWAQYPPDDPPSQARRRAAAVERLAGSDIKHILELGCGSGLIAGAMALLGHKVVAVDLVDEAVANARRVAAKVPNGEMIVFQEDFYEIKFDDKFDVVCYFDGFGIGSDSDQRRLLHRIAEWLKPHGCALIDVYSPWVFANDSGEVYQQGNMMGRCDFDPDECRLLDKMWPVGSDETKAINQSLRCYSPADFQLLLQGTNLKMHTLEPYESAFEFDNRVPLQEAEIYLAKLVLSNA